MMIFPNTAPPWIKEAEKCLGLHEGTNENPNPVVLKFFKEIGHPEIKNDHKEPWCAVFIGAMFLRANVKEAAPIAETMWATDWEKFGIKLLKPVFGCVGVKRRGEIVPGVHPSGHVTFIVGETPTSFLCLGGNQGDRVCIEAIRKAGFFAFRWPSSWRVAQGQMLVSIPELKSDLSEA